jgi:hypothetical protein
LSKANREAPIAVTVENGRLVPADAWAAEEIAKLPRGARFNAYLTLAKSAVDDEHGRLLQRYMAGIAELYDWLPNTGPGTEFPTATQLRREILKQIGFCETWPQRDGSIRKEAMSMSRDKMSFADLQICFELSRHYVGAWTEALTGERYEPWERWELDHPLGARP